MPSIVVHVGASLPRFEEVVVDSLLRVLRGSCDYHRGPGQGPGEPGAVPRGPSDALRALGVAPYEP